jgi:porphobilinogen deaminase
VLRLRGVIAAPDGSSVIRAQTADAVCAADALGRRLAHTLLRDGGAALLNPTLQKSAGRDRQGGIVRAGVQPC